MVNPAPVRSSSSASRSGSRPAGPHPWALPIVAGLCFGLGYGVVQRLMLLELPRGGELQESFRVREFPGTSLESLRMRVGGEAKPIRGDLGVLEQEEQQRKAAEERRQREQEIEAERQRQNLSDALDRDLEPAPAPAALPEPELPPADDFRPPQELTAPALSEPFTP
jgi:hypothetical protein